MKVLLLAAAAQAFLLTPSLKERLFAENGRGLELYEESRYLEAAEVFAKAEREIARSERFLLINAANSYHHAGRYARANGYYDELFRLHKDLDPAVLRLMARSYAFEDRWADARKAIEALPDPDEMRDWSAAALYAEGWPLGDVRTWWLERAEDNPDFRIGPKHAFASAMERIWLQTARANRSSDARYREILALARFHRFRAECGKLDCSYLSTRNSGEDILKRIGALQASVPARLAPTEAALEWSRKAREAATSDFKKAASFYRMAVFESPWWEDAHFDLAMASFAAGEVYEPPYALRVYLAFEPEGQRAKTASKLLKKWTRLLQAP